MLKREAGSVMKIVWQRAAAYVVALDAQQRVLLTQFEKKGHPESGAWTLPGGGMEWGEEAQDTALRELKEETGLTADIGPLLGVQSEWFEESTSQAGECGLALRLIFEAQDCAGNLKCDHADDDTTVGAAWFTIEEVRHLARVKVVDFGLSLVSKGDGVV
ncbi:NUDIX hydrolase [Roseovarius indicus]|uniref:NUDIX hydrolase n=2 Tax=Roseovarius indicus TaxID=540747 RepID=UPI001911BFC8|nr:NUDIX hydrolase [Roseovarius indicus]